ncbi:glycosyltransferase family 2 protein [Eubacterium limosum]|uniref:glycosyltransferase family 2 protein n=1 Tax=Eubacterium limosum TaxID=1736 RepID=UPI0010643410|nr:glycosyltransferase [Eubacterium limosum]
MNDHTFVVCAYKESPYLELCLKSLVNQTIKTKILIVSSTKNNFIQSLARKYDVPLFIHEDGGIGQDWNFGLRTAKSQYVTLAHQDDIYAKDYGKDIINSLEKYDDALIAFTDYQEVRNNCVITNNINLKIKRKLLLPLKINGRIKFFKRIVLSFGNPICCPSVTYNMKLLEKFTFDLDWNTNLDWNAWEKLSRKTGRFIYLPKVLLSHRIHNDSETSNTIHNNQRAIEDFEMLTKFWPKHIARLIFHQYTKSERSNQL